MTIIAKEDNAKALKKRGWALINQEDKARPGTTVTTPSVTITYTTTPPRVLAVEDVKPLEGEERIEEESKSPESSAESDKLIGGLAEAEEKALGYMLGSRGCSEFCVTLIG
ncbi:hypothetical protein [Sneathiella sp.]|uniref:hypothetical protein n=1 Tax=Sneathiella sp. TaxID=1964365 RepID=UPI00356A0DDD